MEGGRASEILKGLSKLLLEVKPGLPAPGPYPPGLLAPAPGGHIPRREGALTGQRPLPLAGPWGRFP